MVVATDQVDEAAEIVMRLERCLASRIAAAGAEQGGGLPTAATSVAPRSDDFLRSDRAAASFDALAVPLSTLVSVAAFTLTILAYVRFDRGFATALTAVLVITGAVAALRRSRIAWWATTGVLLGAITALLS